MLWPLRHSLKRARLALCLELRLSLACPSNLYIPFRTPSARTGVLRHLVMQDSGIGHFVGAMTPEMFFDQYMGIAESVPSPPEVDFTRVSMGKSVKDMCEGLVSVHI